jgi:hypothetical protein
MQTSADKRHGASDVPQGIVLSPQRSSKVKAPVAEKPCWPQPPSVGLGVSFVLLGGINVWVVLEAWSRVKAAKASARMLTLHRIGGYLFLTLFCVMTYYVTARLRDGVENSATVTLHWP